MDELNKFDTVEVIGKDNSVKGFILACYSNCGHSLINVSQATILKGRDLKTINYHEIEYKGLNGIYFLKVFPSRCVLFEKDMSQKLNTPANEL